MWFQTSLHDLNVGGKVRFPKWSQTKKTVRITSSYLARNRKCRYAGNQRCFCNSQLAKHVLLAEGQPITLGHNQAGKMNYYKCTCARGGFQGNTPAFIQASSHISGQEGLMDWLGRTWILWLIKFEVGNNYWAIMFDILSDRYSPEVPISKPEN